MSAVGSPLGLLTISARVAEIQSRISALQGVTGSPALSRTGASGVLGGYSTGAAFADVLSSVTATDGTTSGLTSSSTKLNSAGVPVELAAYGNGKIPSSALASVGHGNHQLWAPAAQAFQQMEAAAKRDGVTIGVTDTYRSYEQQVDVANRKGLYSQGGLAAKPGTSDHGWGMAVDLDLDSKAQAWMRANAGRFGFAEDTPREPWHWKFTPVS